jgi:hydroxyacylglutathione hydrolase
MILRRFYEDKLAQASFLIGCGATGEAAVIDPNRDVDQYLQAAAAEKLCVTAVTETHIHADFVSGSRELAHRAGARLFLSDEGDAEWKYGFAGDPNVTLVRDGNVIRIGRIRLDVLATPGHTPEHVTFILTDEPASDQPLGAFTGDFIFVGDVGRPDLLERAASYVGTMEKGARVLFRSLARFKETLPDHLLLWPSHGAGSACGKSLGGVPVSTLAYEKLVNWGLRCGDEERFVADVLAGQPEPPVYFKEMKRINKLGPPTLGAFRLPERLQAEAVLDLLDRGETVVDRRRWEDVARGYIPGVLNIPGGRAFTNWAGWLLAYDRPVYLLSETEAGVREAVRDLALIGLDDVRGWFDAGALGAYESKRGGLERVEQIEPAAAAARLTRGEVAVLDVRGMNEYLAGHIPTVQHIPLGSLAQRAAEVPRDKMVVVHCAAGARSPIAVSLLRKLGVKNVINMPGGFDEYSRSGLPVARTAVSETGPVSPPS